MYARQLGMGWIAVMMAGIFVAAACLGQQKPASNPNSGELFTQLHSDQWTVRAKAYQQLSSAAKAVNNVQVQQALLDLLDRENRLIESTLRDSNEQAGVSSKYGEDYGEYVGQLGETVDSFANWNDPHQVCIFVHESYDPESKFAAKIVAHASVAVPCLIQMYGSDVGLTRAEAAPVLVQAWVKAGKQLDPSLSERVRQIILTALRDPSEAVRSHTVGALGKFGGQDMIPALKAVAETDPAPEVQGHSIRKRAARAVEQIQKRTGSPQN